MTCSCNITNRMEGLELKVKLHPVLWVILAVTALIISVCVLLTIGALSEKAPSHVLDFQKIEVNQLSQDIDTVDDGLKYVLEEAQLWRDDVVLTSISIFSNGKDEIQTQSGKITYGFEFPFVDEESPSGAIFVTINTNSNSIELVSASHDGDEYFRNILENQLVLKDGEIFNFYKDILDEFGEKEIFKHKHQSFQFKIEHESVYCTIKLSDNEEDYISKKYQAERN